MFEIIFKDGRYLPFEGADVTSKWRLELPQFRQFDYDTISDVVVHLRYMSNEGGERLKGVAKEYAKDFMKGIIALSQQEGLFVILDLKHDFPMEWNNYTKTHNPTPKFTVKLDKNRFPYFVGTKAITVTKAVIYNKDKPERQITNSILINQNIDLDIADMKAESPFLIIQYTLT